MGNVSAQQEHDEDLVFYCRSCHSLKILVDEGLSDDDWDGSYCGDCNSCDIGQCTMDEWLAEEERRKKIREALEWNK